MVKTAFVKLWDQTIGAVAWDENQQKSFFEYGNTFLTKRLEVSPIKIPLSKKIYSFPELQKSTAFKGLCGLLADSLPDKYGNELINIWLWTCRNGILQNSYLCRYTNVEKKLTKAIDDTLIKEL